MSTNEWAGGGYWTPEPVSPADEIARLSPAFRASVIAEREQGVLAASKHWPESEDFAASWFEDDARIEALLREQIGGPDRWLACLPQAASALMSGLLELKRDVWIERLLWMALLSAACQHDRPPMPWPAFVVIAKALQRGAPLAEVPLMQAVAERSVQSGSGRSGVGSAAPGAKAMVQQYAARAEAIGPPRAAGWGRNGSYDSSPSVRRDPQGLRCLAICETAHG